MTAKAIIAMSKAPQIEARAMIIWWYLESKNGTLVSETDVGVAVIIARVWLVDVLADSVNSNGTDEGAWTALPIGELGAWDDVGVDAGVEVDIEVDEDEEARSIVETSLDVGTSVVVDIMPLLVVSVAVSVAKVVASVVVEPP